MNDGEILQVLREMKAPFCACDEQVKRNAALDRAIKAIADIKIISEALIDITEYECCHYGYHVACDKAEEWLKEVDG